MIYFQLRGKKCNGENECWVNNETLLDIKLEPFGWINYLLCARICRISIGNGSPRLICPIRPLSITTRTSIECSSLTTSRWMIIQIPIWSIERNSTSLKPPKDEWDKELRVRNTKDSWSSIISYLIVCCHLATQSSCLLEMIFIGGISCVSEREDWPLPPMDTLHHRQRRKKGMGLTQVDSIHRKSLLWRRTTDHRRNEDDEQHFWRRGGMEWRRQRVRWWIGTHCFLISTTQAITRRMTIQATTIAAGMRMASSEEDRSLFIDQENIEKKKCISLLAEASASEWKRGVSVEEGEAAFFPPVTIDGWRGFGGGGVCKGNI